MKDRPSSPLSFWAWLSFAWVTKPVNAARKKEPLDIDELYLPEENHADSVFASFQHAWDDATSDEKHKGKQPLLRALCALWGRSFFVGGLFKLLWSALVICGAFYFVRSLLLHVNDEEEGHPYELGWTGWVLALGFFSAATLWGLCLQRMGYICMNTGVKVRTALLTAVTRKAIMMSQVSPETASDIVGFVSNDIGKVYDGLQEFHYLWTAPIEALTILSLLAYLVKGWALPALLIVTLIMVSQYGFGWLIAVNKFKSMSHANHRGSILQEALPSIKLIKYYGWEKFFEDKIKAIRKLESKLATTNILYKTLNICLVFTVPPLSAFVIFAAYEFQVERLQSTIAFTTLTLFNILRFPLVVLPKALRAASEAAAALVRIEEFLLQTHDHEEQQHDRTGRGIDIDNAVFQYDGHDGEAFKLRVPSLHVAPGEVVAIVGRVGAGKTALLDALLGNMPCKSGSVRIGGRIAYVPQVAWVQNLSIKDNITFGNPFDEARYREVLHSCALERDLEMLPQGDASMGGLRGMNLSGGQRQRVNIARAAYFNADTVLLDNALSAVDHHTADHIFSETVQGMFHDKAVLLVTHQLQFVRRCTKVAIVDGGEIKYFGPFNAEAQSTLARYLPVPQEDSSHHEPIPARKPAANKTKAVLPAAEARPRTSLPMLQSAGRFLRAGPQWKFWLALAFGLCSQSSRQISDFWVRFWSSDNYGWYKDENEHGGYASHAYAWGYGVITFAFFAIQILRTGTFFAWGKGAADRMHKKKLHRVLNTPLGFFLAKPVGDLLSTFSTDQDKADEALPDVLHLAGVYAIILLSTSVTVSINIPEFVAFVAVLSIVTIVMLRLYLPAATQIKKLRLDSAGGLVGMTAEVLEGLPLVQAYSHEAHFVKEFTKHTDSHHRSLFNADSLNLWVSFYCDFYGAVMLVAVAMFAVSQKGRGASVVGLAFSNTIQLLVFYTWTLRLITEAISLSGSIEQLTWLSYCTPIDGKDDINNEGQSLESALLPDRAPLLHVLLPCAFHRVFHPCNNDNTACTSSQPARRPAASITWKELQMVAVEAPKVEDSERPWPTNGVITFEGVKMRYRPTANLALNGVSFTIQHGEKVGIVGRTGSGKSTLLMALYRMFDLAAGRITVSGVDIATLPLQQARRGLSIIPQEPVMWTGSLRDNLDPFRQHSDMELFTLLQEVGLAGQAAAAGGLDGHVDGSGSDSWSLGQMQLVCLVRAALNKVPVVCMDEATAALDPHTEHHVLEVANKLFADRTILTVAHRLEAVIEADTVLVMEQGKVAETGPASALLSDPASWFSKLVDMSGPAEAATLRATAARHFAQRGIAAEA